MFVDSGCVLGLSFRFFWPCFGFVFVFVGPAARWFCLINSDPPYIYIYVAHDIYVLRDVMQAIYVMHIRHA